MASKQRKGGKMHKYVQRARDEAGFTLIELMIVIVILGVLAGIVIFAVGGITDNGNVAACKSDVKTVSVAVEAYKAKNGTYPTFLDAGVPSTVDVVHAPNQFLRPQPGLGTVTLANAPGGYTITYTPADGSLAVTGSTTC
jgi:prepilin-type N-terminal cleavage/methylation domain-containing protein